MTQSSMMSDLGETASSSMASSNVNPSIFEPSASERTVHSQRNLTRAIVDADPQLKDLQHDLLILTSFNENETLHWRPSWFKQEDFSERFWTLHNPPNVVTERIPQISRGRQYYMRRMRRTEDVPPAYIKSWDHWRWYCDMYGVPHDFLCEGHIKLISLGLPQDENGLLGSM